MPDRGEGEGDGGSLAGAGRGSDVFAVLAGVLLHLEQ